MRVVIKPAGFILLLCMLGVLGGLAFLRNQSPKDVTKIASTAQQADTAQQSVASPAAKNLLVNAGFEEASEPVIGAWPGSQGTATGVQGKGWTDDSLWGAVKLVYALDNQNPHGGNKSQSIKIVANQDGQAQFSQRLPAVVGRNYEATLWVRASKKGLPVNLTLRKVEQPYTAYKSVDATVDTEWRQLSVVGSPTEAGDMFVMVSFRDVGATLWIDDATLVPQP